MTLLAIADHMDRAVRDDYTERQLRAGLSNLVTGFQLNHFSKPALQRRCDAIVREFGVDPGKTRPVLLAAMKAAMDRLKELDHYERQEELVIDTDVVAVSFQSDAGGDAGQWWMGGSAPAKAIADRFPRLVGQVGAPDKPLWLTPYRGEIKALVEEAKLPYTTDGRRTIIAARIVACLGLCHLHAEEGVLAFITKSTIGDLRHLNAAGAQAKAVGSTVLEARMHPRFRPWPRPSGTDAYGRTYDLDRAKRLAAKSREHGAREATRPCMPMGDFADCVFVGTLAATPRDRDDDAYLTEIAAGPDSASLLRELARMTA